MVQPAARMQSRKNPATGAHTAFVTSMTSRASIFIACALLGACAAQADDIDCSDGKCDVDQSCSDPQYGDGVCQTNLSCAVPDIDCFRTFDNDADAAAWYTGMEAMVAQAEG